MTTLKGQELHEYLDNLETCINNHHPCADTDFSTAMHKWMSKIIAAEKTFLNS